MADGASLDKLVAQYFQLVEPRELELPCSSRLVTPAVQRAIFERMFDDARVSPVPPAGYRSRVLKMIISQIEEAICNPEEDEILDDLMNCWSDLVAQPKPSSLQQAQELAYVKYTAPPHDGDDAARTVITLESRGLILGSGTTGFRTWEAALHLGTFLAIPAGAPIVRSKRVIELGAGTGFVSMFCAKHLGVESVVVTDREPALIENIRSCLARNGLDQGVCRPAIWDWGSPLRVTDDGHHDGDSDPLEFDVALGADLIYDVDLVPLLLSTIQDLFTTYRLKEFIISATLRNQDTFQTFLNACKSLNLTLEHIQFESPAGSQTGFFHSTSIPIEMYRIKA
ncbi:hypothetical protein ASPZODRAFT_157906 [Penicilliopsis zonata CBS 506.65]|uniref:FAM86 N-terminal domain-containing protein n=1 Tax=Penicilliopsis zonata CBS 506.65 TaxID=1073090 RepID=A0A1L9SLJ5_9EURO|nr:hypothetical protein ASPZODRAFT_157906 [Penicilliopsis zonata CBS 506.65]OJJ48099.1 hypothetical protein ASPZODRAFT_157906 [Penicilliopsis zonata CBS 506.65]